MVRMSLSGFKRAAWHFSEKRVPQRKRPSEEKSRETALVVDEANTCRSIAQGILQSFDIDAVGVPTPEAAMDLLIRGGVDYYNFILVDFHMTTITGPETARRLRLMGVTTKILGVSLNHTEEKARAFVEAGADACIGKPLTAESLGNVLQELRNM
ncbi:hypothetical protein L6164_009908 [Bauhinia variegata]|uniref:Uncharacterized protein n=1 Tax=Bauhinia variegata TaxID=167791 RepID=A0ACB9PL67_BAUVA|nr:hypothetical protein L6164_009908 [Bauhinia variegata]